MRRKTSSSMVPDPPPEPVADEVLAEAAQRGERRAFAALVERHGGALLALLERRVGEHQEALDSAQDVWIKVFRGLARYDSRRAFRPWLYSIVLNHLRDLLRRRERSPFARVVHLDAQTLDPRAPRSFDPSGRVEERAAIEAALARVPEPFRTALVLIDVLGLGYREAAAAESCAVGTMKSRVSRGRLAFRVAYRELSGEVELESELPAKPAPALKIP